MPLGTVATWRKGSHTSVDFWPVSVRSWTTAGDEMGCGRVAGWRRLVGFRSLRPQMAAGAKHSPPDIAQNAGVTEVTAIREFASMIKWLSVAPQRCSLSHLSMEEVTKFLNVLQPVLRDDIFDDTFSCVSKKARYLAPTLRKQKGWKKPWRF